MKILDWYVSKSVAAAMLVVLVVLTGLNALTLIVEQLGDVRGHYTFWSVLKYTLWRLPGSVSESVGFVAMVGSLVGLGVLANNNELTVMRASGVSLLQIVGMTMLPILVLIVVGVGLEEYSAHTDRRAEADRSAALAANAEGVLLPARKQAYASQATQTNEGQVWNRHMNEFVRFDRVLPGGMAYGISRIAFGEDKEILFIQQAKRGIYEADGWRLEEVVTHSFTEEQINEDSKNRLRWDSSLTPQRLLYVSAEPDNLAAEELADYSAFLQEQGRDDGAYRLEYWKRLLRPAELFGLMLIAVSFVFGSLRRITIAQRVFMGVMAGIVFRVLQNVVATSSLVFGFSPINAVLLPIAVCIVIGLLLLYRVR